MAQELSLFDSVATIARKFSTEVFTEPDDDWAPVVFMRNRDNEQANLLLSEFMENDYSKDLLADVILPGAIRKFQAETVVMVISTWVSETSSKALNEKGAYVRPSQQADRQERLMIMELKREGVTREAFAEIIRHESSPPTLGEWEDIEATEHGGRFVPRIVSALKQVRA